MDAGVVLPDWPPGSRGGIATNFCVRIRKLLVPISDLDYAAGMAEPAGAAEGSLLKRARSASRAPWGSISRDDIVQTAVRIIEAGGYEEMSMRSLAGGLGVAPMSLYRHIRDKDDLLEEVVDLLLAEVWRPAAGEDDWHAWLVEAAANLRQFLVTQPAALHVYLKHPVVTPAAIQRMDAILSVLRQAGLDEATARSAYGTLQTYTIGFAALEASRAGWISGSDDTSSRANQLAAYTTAGQFMQGLNYLLEGISRHIQPGQEPNH